VELAEPNRRLKDIGMSNVVTALKLDREQKNAFITMMTEVFTHNPFIAKLLHDDRQKIEALIRLTSSYYLKRVPLKLCMMMPTARWPRPYWPLSGHRH